MKTSYGETEYGLYHGPKVQNCLVIDFEAQVEHLRGILRWLVKGVTELDGELII